MKARQLSEIAMPARLVRPATMLLAFALIAPAAGAATRTHHRTTKVHHAAAHHGTTHRKAAKSTGRHDSGRHSDRQADRHAHRHADRHGTKPAEHHAATPAGATNVPGGGLKLFCPAHHNPLLIRKATQGAGTTVTVVCR